MDSENNFELATTNKFKGDLDHLKKRRNTKIEKLGINALELLINSIRKGLSKNRIAKQLSELYKVKITVKDIDSTLGKNALVMQEYEKGVDVYNKKRANIILNESNLMVDTAETLKDLADSLKGDLNKQIGIKDKIAISKALTDIARTSTQMVKNYKEITGQLQKTPLINIDNSQKTVNFNENSELSKHLAKELSRANFNIDSKYDENPNKVKEVKLQEQDKEDMIVDATLVNEDNTGSL